MIRTAPLHPGDPERCGFCRTTVFPGAIVCRACGAHKRRRRRRILLLFFLVYCCAFSFAFPHEVLRHNAPPKGFNHSDALVVLFAPAVVFAVAAVLSVRWAFRRVWVRYVA